MDTIVVTRHKALVEFLIETGKVSAETPVLSHVTSKDVEGMHVIGILPMHLAALAATVTEIPLDIPAELRGKELNLEQVRQFAGDPVKYSVRKEEDVKQFAWLLGNIVAQGSDNWLANGTEDDVLRFNGLPARCGTKGMV
ncbi:MAG: CRISPR-associated protein Csx16 [Betaproteobacteria bacterium]